MTNILQDIIEAEVLTEELTKLDEEFKKVAQEAIDELRIFDPKTFSGDMSQDEFDAHRKRIKDHYLHLQALQADLETGLEIMKNRYGHVILLGQLLKEIDQ